MEIKFNQNTKRYIIGDKQFTKSEFINYIKDDLLETALVDNDVNFNVDESKNKISVANYDNKDLVIGGTNVLLYGVPGSGKSWTIEQEYCRKGTIVERLVFHPDYTYSDFVGQILPCVSENGQVSYEFTPGPFTNILKKAYENPTVEYILVIEEINRGNAPAIFGEIFQLLDRKIEEKPGNTDPLGTSEYGITNSNIAKVVYGDENRKVKIPANLSIIATMNTSDQNVFTLDTAFQRRWSMRLIDNDFDRIDQELANAIILDTGLRWRAFCTIINDEIIGNNVRMTSSEDKRLGAYFVHKNDLLQPETPSNLPFTKKMYTDLMSKASSGTINLVESGTLDLMQKSIKQFRKFPEKVIKYLWDDAFKFNREKIFNTSKFKSLESIIDWFVFEFGAARFDIFSENIVQAFVVEIEKVRKPKSDES